jgi:hypothetical protein
MTYILCMLDEPIASSTNWLEIYHLALRRGFAINAWGCLFTLLPGVTVKRR